MAISRNKLTNGDFELGAMTNWTASNVTAVAGGPDTSTYCAEVAATGSTYQSVAPGIELDSVTVAFDFLPEFDLDADDTSTKVYVELSVQYTDDSDEFVLPARYNDESGVS